MGPQRHALVALPLGKTRYPLYRRLGGPQSRSGRVRKTSTPPGFDPRTVQPVASRYTDCAIPALHGTHWLSRNFGNEVAVTASFISEGGPRCNALRNTNTSSYTSETFSSSEHSTRTHCNCSSIIITGCLNHVTPLKPCVNTL